VNDSHKRAQIGTGLGLSIVKGILEMHNAQFGVESKVGMGSTFWFIL
jgi:signal transduction histidine kinase